MKKDLLTRLNEGPIICAEGYLFAMERRGYLSAGAFVPEVVLEHPEVVSQLHKEFIRAGSDVVQAFTYYGHREKLRIIGKEDLLEPLQKNALKIANDAKDSFKDLDLMVCGDVANTNIFDPNDKNSFMILGGGKGNEPLVFNDGGKPYRGFLEGKIKDNSYCLILHLSNQEYKTIPKNKSK